MLKIRTKLRIVAAIAACLAVITMITSCEKEDDEVDIKLLDTETSGLFHMRKFFYDEQNRIKEMWTYSGEQLMDKAIITYTGDDLTKLEFAYLDEGEFVAMDTRNFIKNGNTISYSMSVYVVEGEEEGSQNINCTITLNNDGFIEKHEGVLLGMSWVNNYTYINDNLIKWLSVTKGYGSEETRESNYTYGTYRSAYSGCNTPKWFMFYYFHQYASHNAVKKEELEYIDAMGIKTIGSIAYEYVFDSDRFPKKCTETINDEYEITEFKYKN